MNIEKALRDIFHTTINPIILDFYYTLAEHRDLKCIYSNDVDRNQDKTISIYDTPSMLRTLALKSEMFSLDLREKMYSSSDPELCFILEWSVDARKIILFNLKNLSQFQENEFVDCLVTKREKLLQVFDHYYEREIKR